MDRRQQKTREAIFMAFAQLLEEKNYAKITVQEIIDTANVGRSTFYSHFETKDSLLNALCSDIFDHVFSHHLQTEKTHDFSDSSYAFSQQLTHILYHLRDNGSKIPQLLKGESGELFLNYFRSYLPKVFSPLLKHANTALPKSYLTSYLSGSFADTIRWWVNQDMQTEPEMLAEYYLLVVEQGILQ